jgi:hypothetical protein
MSVVLAWSRIPQSHDSSVGDLNARRNGPSARVYNDVYPNEPADALPNVIPTELQGQRHVD